MWASKCQLRTDYKSSAHPTIQLAKNAPRDAPYLVIFCFQTNHEPPLLDYWPFRVVLNLRRRCWSLHCRSTITHRGAACDYAACNCWFRHQLIYPRDSQQLCKRPHFFNHTNCATKRPCVCHYCGQQRELELRGNAFLTPWPQMVLTFNANGGGSFMTGDLAIKISRESTSTLSALNLPWYFEKEPDPFFYLSGSMHWSPILSLNATLPTSTPVHVHYLISLPYTQALRVSVAVKAAVRAIQYRSTVIGQSSISISLFIQGECDMRTTWIFAADFLSFGISHIGKMYRQQLYIHSINTAEFFPVLHSTCHQLQPHSWSNINFQLESRRTIHAQW